MAFSQQEKQVLVLGNKEKWGYMKENCEMIKAGKSGDLRTSTKIGREIDIK
jgi:hypothetical protein